MKKIMWIDGVAITESHMQILGCSDMRWVGREAYYVIAHSSQMGSAFFKYSHTTERDARDRYNRRISEDGYDDLFSKRKIIGGI